MKYNSKLIERYAKGVPGEQTVLLSTQDVLKEGGFSSYKALTKHRTGMPLSAYRDENGELNIIQRDGLCHALVAGSTGCGKSMRYLENCLFNLDGTVSVIVADVKGELYKNTASYLKKTYGEDNVKYMDFIHPERSEILFNPVAQLARKYLEADLHPESTQFVRNEVLADLKKLYDKLFPIKSNKDVSWDEGARGFIYGITLALFDDMFLTKAGEVSTKRKRILPEQINFEAISEVYSRFEYGSDFNDHGFFSSRDKNALCQRYVRGIINDAPNTRACYLQLVENYLSDFSYPDVRNLTVTDNFDVVSLSEKPQVIFLTYDISDGRMRNFVNQYVVRALDGLKRKSIDSGDPLTVPVMFLLDEFPTLQPDEIYPTIFSVGRGLNIFITAIVQDYTQLETFYSGGVAQQIRNNCNLTFFLGTNDVNTAKAVKEQIGKHVIPDPANYLQGGIKFIETYLVSEDELMHRVKPGDAYITINNHMPVKGYFELYYDCPEYLAYPKTREGVRSAVDIRNKKYHYDVSWMDKYVSKWEF
ncbi:MAG: type IV secretory system conjugative DNA transfer family protein [Clostridia bacterium]|nr:type IV secretory system conjugative DNA transfer family protein [Clostridia bacterium]